MGSRQTPPGRRANSIFSRGVVKCSGPHQLVTSSGSVHALQTSSRGASSSRSMTIVCAAISNCSVIAVFLSLYVLEVIREALETAVPDFAVLLDPVGDLAQRRTLEP